MSRLLTEKRELLIVNTVTKQHSQAYTDYTELIAKLKDMQERNELDGAIDLSVDDSISILNQKLENTPYQIQF